MNGSRLLVISRSVILRSHVLRVIVRADKGGSGGNDEASIALQRLARPFLQCLAPPSRVVAFWGGKGVQTAGVG